MGSKNVKTQGQMNKSQSMPVHGNARTVLVLLWLGSFLVTVKREHAGNIPMEENIIGSGLGISEV